MPPAQRRTRPPSRPCLFATDAIRALNSMAGQLQPEAKEKTRRQRTKTCACLRPIYGTNPATKSRAKSLVRSQSHRIPTRNSARTAPALSVLLVSRPGKTIHASRPYLQKKQPRRRKPVPSGLVPLAKSGTRFSVCPLARSGVCPAKLRRALLAKQIAPSPPPERRITSTF